MAGIGILGGTFDPLHNGHLQIAEAAIDEYRLDQVLFIPAALPPHKNHSVVATFEHRFNMVERGLGNHESFKVSALEADTEAPSYTYHTLKTLAQGSGAGHTFYFIIGGDAFLAIQSWYKWRQVLMGTNFIITKRSGFATEPIDAMLLANDYLKTCVNHHTSWQKRDGGTIIGLLNHLPDAISSSDIRWAIQQGKQWQHQVPEIVVEYILKHRIYH